MESNSIKNITDKIKLSCEYVNSNSEYVRINNDKIKKFVDENFQTLTVPSWSSCHFDPNQYGIELSLAFIFTIDSLNFCFWPYEKYSNNDFEYCNLVDNLVNQLKTNPEFFTAGNLSNLKIEELISSIFVKDFPLLDERTRSLNELGILIKNKYNNSFFNFLKHNNFSCLQIVNSIIEGVTTYRDETLFKGRQIFLYKRAQILAADLYYMLKELTTPINLLDACELTMFADYRVPQILLELGILEYKDELLEKVINKIEILPNSIEEIEIRANTILGVETIKNQLNNRYLSLEIDYVLWNIGEIKRKDVKPHHRTLSIFY